MRAILISMADALIEDAQSEVSPRIVDTLHASIKMRVMPMIFTVFLDLAYLLEPVYDLFANDPKGA
jgi:hypothetical protein